MYAVSRMCDGRMLPQRWKHGFISRRGRLTVYDLLGSCQHCAELVSRYHICDHGSKFRVSRSSGQRQLHSAAVRETYHLDKEFSAKRASRIELELATSQNGGTLACCSQAGWSECCQECSGAADWCANTAQHRPAVTVPALRLLMLHTPLIAALLHR